MKSISGRAQYIVAIAALVFAAPAFAQQNQNVVPIQVPKLGNADVAAICKLDTDFAVGQLLIDPVEDGIHDEGSYLGVQLVLDVAVDTLNNSLSFEDLTSPSQQAGTSGVEAVIAGTKNNSPANVYCYINADSDTGIQAPGGEIPAVLEVYWSRGPCLIAPENVANACAVYNGIPPGDPALQAAHYLQEHIVAPEEPINICGCPYNEGSGLQQRLAEFCASDPSAQGACPGGDQGITGLETQATVTEGDNTCQRVVIGGRSLYIGDTCN